MLAGVGPGAYAQRPDVPDHTLEGLPKIVPLRVATDFTVAAKDPDPRGMDVIGADRRVAGKVRDIWVDRSEVLIRYLEVDVAGSSGQRSVLLPMTMAKVSPWRRQVKVKALHARHFADVPGLQHADQVTLLEEEKICAYYAGGTLYADPLRMGPVI